ncbi:MAG: DUF433 domain-containing protein [Rhodomicrobium sp.]
MQATVYRWEHSPRAATTVGAKILEDFPELTREDIRACVAFAADRERWLCAHAHSGVKRATQACHPAPARSIKAPSHSGHPKP